MLAGAIAGLLARGADSAQAAVWATHLHAAAGDRLAARVAPVGFLARELCDELPHALAATVDAASVRRIGGPSAGPAEAGAAIPDDDRRTV